MRFRGLAGENRVKLCTLHKCTVHSARPKLMRLRLKCRPACKELSPHPVSFLTCGWKLCILTCYRGAVYQDPVIQSSMDKTKPGNTFADFTPLPSSPGRPPFLWEVFPLSWDLTHFENEHGARIVPFSHSPTQMMQGTTTQCDVCKLWMRSHKTDIYIVLLILT